MIDSFLSLAASSHVFTLCVVSMAVIINAITFVERPFLTVRPFEPSCHNWNCSSSPIHDPYFSPPSPISGSSASILIKFSANIKPKNNTLSQMASFISLLILSVTPYVSFLTSHILHGLSLVLIVALAIYFVCWVSFDILMAFADLMEIPDPMSDLYSMIAPLFMPAFHFDEEFIEDNYLTHSPAVSLWATSVLAFVLWALPDRIVAVDPERFLGQFDVIYFNDPYVLHPWTLSLFSFVTILFSPLPFFIFAPGPVDFSLTFRADDESNLLTLPDTTRALTTWTLLVYLSRCSGGETVFYPDSHSQKQSSSSSSRHHPPTSSDPIEVAPEPGMALLHKHGLRDCLLHEGRAVLGGEKWVLRSDLCVLR